MPEFPRAMTIPELTRARGRRRGRVGLLTGCVQRHLFPSVHRDTVTLLALAGYDVVVPRHQGCCGALDLHAGRVEPYRERAQALTVAFPRRSRLRRHQRRRVRLHHARVRSHLAGVGGRSRLAERTRDVSEVLEDAELPLGVLEVTVTYHDACHLAHGQRVRTQPRALLARIPGLSLVELQDSDLCCGSAGVYNLLEPDMADRLLAMKLERIVETGARIVAAGNPGCVLQIAKGARRRRLDLEVRHPVELLARAVEAGERSREI